MAYPGILKGTGHCTEERMLIDGRWAAQIGNWLIRHFFARGVAQQKWVINYTVKWLIRHHGSFRVRVGTLYCNLLS